MALIDNYKFWNKRENTTSDIGSNLTTVGTINHPTGYFNNGAQAGVAGSYEYFTTTGLADFDPDDFWFEFWVKPTINVVNGIVQSGSILQEYFEWRYDANNYVYFTSVANSTATVLDLRLNPTFRRYQITTGFNMTAGNWYHLAVAYKQSGIDGGSTILEVYLTPAGAGSPVLVYSSTVQWAAHSFSTGQMNIGANSSSPSTRYHQGVLDNNKIACNITSSFITDALANRENEGFPTAAVVQPIIMII
jgi:hypothetical protein